VGRGVEQEKVETFLLLDKGSITANVNTLLQATGKQNQNDMPLFATKSGSSQNLAHSVFFNGFCTKWVRIVTRKTF